MTSYINWDEVEELVDELALQIIDGGREYAAIHAIPRGGLVLGVMLSHKLGLPLLNAEWLYAQHTTHPDRRYLIVDDINDTGLTLGFWNDLTMYYDTAVIHQKERSKSRSLYVGEDINNDEWVVYPWECKETEEERSKVFIKERGL